MPYSKTNWVNNSTPVNAANLNNVEQGIADAEPHRGATAPTSPVTGKLWEDTNTSPATLKAWTGSTWETVGSSGGSGVSATDLASTTDVAKGDALVGVKHTGTGAVGRTQHSKNLDILDARDFGLPSGTGSDASVAIQAAHDALSAWGGVIKIPSGPIRFDNTVNISKPVRFSGEGWYTTYIRKNADVTLFASIAPYATRRQDIVFDNLQVSGNNNVAWTAPLIKIENCSRARFENVLFNENYGIGLHGVNAWDMWLYNTYFAVGGTDGTKPAVFFEASPDDVVSSANNSPNNIWFVNCRMEPMRDGGIWFEDGHLIKCVNMKMEDHGTLRGPIIRLNDTSNFQFTSGQLTYSGPLPSGVSSGLDFVQVNRSSFVSFRDVVVNPGSFTSGQIRSLFRLDGTTTENNHIVFDGIDLAAGSGSPPTSVFSFAGTNKNISRSSVTWKDNWWAAATDSGSPTSYTNSPPLPLIAGSPTDASFNTGPVDGQMAVNTTANSLHFRSGGSWRDLTSTPATVTAVGDASTTLTTASNYEQRWDTRLTAARTVTLPASGAYTGQRFRFVRAAVGAFPLSIGSLFVFPPHTRGEVEVVWSGSAWVLSRQNFWGMNWHEARFKPQNAIAQTIERNDAGSSFSVGTAGTMYIHTIWLPPGAIVTDVKILTGTTGMTIGSNLDAHSWAALYTLDDATMRQTGADATSDWTRVSLGTDDTTTWTANTMKTLTLASPYTTTYEGWHGIALQVHSGTGTGPVQPHFMGCLNSTAVTGTSQIGTPPGAVFVGAGPLTVPSGAPATISATTTTGIRSWMYVT